MEEGEGSVPRQPFVTVWPVWSRASTISVRHDDPEEREREKKKRERERERERDLGI